MIHKKTLTEEGLVNISVSLALQNALANEIHPEMRMVLACINHLKKEIVIFIIYDTKISEKCHDAIDTLDVEITSEAPPDYVVILAIIRIDYPDFWVFKPRPTYCHCINGFSKYIDSDEYERGKKICISIDPIAWENYITGEWETPSKHAEASPFSE